MKRAEAILIARRLAAAVCEIGGCNEDYCNFMREGAYDDEREVQSALAALVFADSQEAKRRNVVELAA